MEKEIIKKLRPIERLYLISKERENIYEKKAKTFCLLYSLISNNFMGIKNKDFKILNGDIFPKEYENEVLNLIKENRYLELNNFIDKNLVFERTLVSLNLLHEEISIKKRFFLKLANVKLTKQPLYFSIQSYYGKKISEGIPILNIVCENNNLYNKTKEAYSILKNKMINAAKEAENKKEKEKSIKEKNKESVDKLMFEAMKIKEE